jgi:hypothetical protein
MASERTTRRDGSFVVRIWWEHSVDQGTGHWRGWIQHVRNGNRISFESMADLAAFIERETGMQATTEEVAQGLG